MGQLIRNKILNWYSTLIMSLVDSVSKELNSMQARAAAQRPVPRNQWLSSIRLSHQLRNTFQNMNTVLSATHGASDEKVEAFSLVEEITDLSNQVTLALTEHEFDVEFSYEAGIPEKVFGDLPRFKQILSILFAVGQKQATSTNSMTWHLKFLRMDEHKNYIIGIEVSFPKGDSIQVDKLNKILSNTSLGSDFFIEFKEELQVYDLGIFVLGKLTNEDGDNIRAEEKEGDMATIQLEMSFSLLNRGKKIFYR